MKIQFVANGIKVTKTNLTEKQKLIVRKVNKVFLDKEVLREKIDFWWNERWFTENWLKLAKKATNDGVMFKK